METGYSSWQPIDGIHGPPNDFLVFARRSRITDADAD